MSKIRPSFPSHEAERLADELLTEIASLTPCTEERIADARFADERRDSAWVSAMAVLTSSGRLADYAELMNRAGRPFFERDARFIESGVRHAAYDAILALAVADLVPGRTVRSLLSAWAAGSETHRAFAAAVAGRRKFRLRAA